MGMDFVDRGSRDCWGVLAGSRCIPGCRGSTVCGVDRPILRRHGGRPLRCVHAPRVGITPPLRRSARDCIRTPRARGSTVAIWHVPFDRRPHPARAGIDRCLSGRQRPRLRRPARAGIDLWARDTAVFRYPARAGMDPGWRDGQRWLRSHARAGGVAATSWLVPLLGMFRSGPWEVYGVWLLGGVYGVWQKWAWVRGVPLQVLADDRGLLGVDRVAREPVPRFGVAACRGAVVVVRRFPVGLAAAGRCRLLRPSVVIVARAFSLGG